MQKVYRIVLLVTVMSCIFCRHLKDNSADGSSYFSSSSSSMFYSSSSASGKDGKPETHVRSMSTEEYRNKEGDKPMEVRKYGEVYKRDNNEEGDLKKRAGTNVEAERKILGEGIEKKKLNKQMEEEYFKDFGSRFDNFFNDLDTPMLDDPFFERFNNNHGRYGKFLKEVAGNQLDHH
jgi:hypothetical protein